MSLKIVKPATPAEKSTRSTVDTVELTPSLIDTWQVPGFQRPLRVNAKVLALVEEIKQAGGVVPGVLTLGVVGGIRYRLDGQHRLEAFKLSGLDLGYADVRTVFAADLAELGEEFVRLNSRLVTMRPDDILRGIEATYPALQLLRKRCGA